MPLPERVALINCTLCLKPHKVVADARPVRSGLESNRIGHRPCRAMSRTVTRFSCADARVMMRSAIKLIPQDSHAAPWRYLGGCTRAQDATGVQVASPVYRVASSREGTFQRQPGPAGPLRPAWGHLSISVKPPSPGGTSERKPVAILSQPRDIAYGMYLYQSVGSVPGHWSGREHSPPVP